MALQRQLAVAESVPVIARLRTVAPSKATWPTTPFLNPPSHWGYMFL
jgi:hypothetical protein